jgi:3-(3-hydroxy-phenyl)propionate hydroxylase
VLDEHGTRTRLDDVLGPDWAVLHTGEVSPQSWRSAGVPVIRISPAGSAPANGSVVDCDGALHRWLTAKRASAVAVRPDKFVYAAAASGRPLPEPPAGFRTHPLPAKDHA